MIIKCCNNCAKTYTTYDLYMKMYKVCSVIEDAIIYDSVCDNWVADGQTLLKLLEGESYESK